MNPSDTASSVPESSRGTRLHGSACDACRRRRVRCDGGQPCRGCSRSNVACTYGSVASRVSSVSYARHLEQQIAELQELLAQRSSNETEKIDMLVSPRDDCAFRTPGSASNVFYGRFGGLSVLYSISAIANSSAPTLGRRSPSREFVEAFEFSSISSPTIGQSKMFAVLPSRQQVENHVTRAMRTALVCHDCLDQAQFSRQLDQIYNMTPDEYTANNKPFVALVYALMALAERYSPLTSEDEVSEVESRDKLKGLTHFDISVKILNESEFDSLDSIRALICQARYLFSASLLSRAHSRISMAIGMAFRLGLHKSSAILRARFSDEELLQRRRVFATLNMMDTYFASLFGLPKLLRQSDSEQTLGLMDEDLPDEGQRLFEQNPTEPTTETILCQKLNDIIAKIAESRSIIDQTSPTETYLEAFDVVTTREAELQEWHNRLPAILGDSDSRKLQAQLTLRLWHACAQIVLYRPFLHHLTRERNSPDFNLRGYEFGSACVRAAMQALWINEAFLNNNFLHEASWLNLYMLVFAATILTFFVTSSSQRTTIEESSAAAVKARDMLGGLGKYNVAARRCFTSLSALLDTIPIPLEMA